MFVHYSWTTKPRIDFPVQEAEVGAGDMLQNSVLGTTLVEDNLKGILI
jgi:hypothetical protein